GRPRPTTLPAALIKGERPGTVRAEGHHPCEVLSLFFCLRRRALRGGSEGKLERKCGAQTEAHAGRRDPTRMRLDDEPRHVEAEAHPGAIARLRRVDATVLFEERLQVR